MVKMSVRKLMPYVLGSAAGAAAVVEGALAPAELMFVAKSLGDVYISLTDGINYAPTLPELVSRAPEWVKWTAGSAFTVSSAMGAYVSKQLHDSLTQE